MTNITYAGISSLVFPGAGQFYNGDVLKGFIFSLGAVCLAEICYDVSEGNRWSTPEITLGVIHLVSLADAIYTAASKTDE